jgi:O-antigen biosynthesis protein
MQVRLPMPNDDIQGELERPCASEPVSDALAVEGWALSRSRVIRVEIYIDLSFVGLAHYGVARPVPVLTFTDTPDAARCGFFHLVELAPYAEGRHQVEARVKSAAGTTQSWWSEFRVVPSRRYADWVQSSTRVYSQPLPAPPANRVHFLLLMTIPDVIDAEAVHGTLMSLERQHYLGFELLIVAGLNQSQQLQEIVASSRYTGKWQVLALAHPVGTSTLIDGFSAEAIGFLQPGAILVPWALAEFAASFDSDDTIDLIYGDEDRTDGTTRFAPVFKPAWSPVFLSECNYVGDIWFARRAMVTKILESFGRPPLLHHLHDVLLRAGAEARRVCHIPTVLHSLGPAAPARSFATAKRKRVNDRGAEEWPTVSVVIPTRLKNREVYTACFSSLFGVTDYPGMEVIAVLNNLSADAPVADFSGAWPVTPLLFSGPFNWSAINNEGVRHASGDYLLFMNDDVEVLHSDWLKVMVRRLIDTGAGASGPLLLYPNRSIQHAGVNLVYSGGGARHLFRFFTLDEPHAQLLARFPREVAAVTGACLLVKRHVFESVGGFDENFPLVSNDIDFCLRLGEAGYSTLFESDASLVHHEGVSRAGMAEMEDVLRFWDRWESTLRRGDAWWNPNLDASCDNWVPDPELWVRPAPRVIDGLNRS